MGYVVADGKSNWLEGVILICESFHLPPGSNLICVSLIVIYNLGLYVIIAVSFWFYPGLSQRLVRMSLADTASL